MTAAALPRSGRLVAGVDCSTQATKVEIRDVDSGAIITTGSAPHPTTTPPCSEQSPSAWWGAFEHAWAAAGSPEVAAISVGGQQHGMVVLDETGTVIRDAKLWNDTETAPDAGWLIKQLPNGAADWAQRCGSVPVAALTIAKLSWLHRSEPEAWERLAKVVLPHDWMTAQLTGAAVDEITTDRGDASGTGYWSAATGQYCWDLLAIVDKDRDWSGAVPRVLGPLEIAGTWHDAVVGAGTGDNAAAALGLGVGVGDILISIGTSGTVSTVSETPTSDQSGAVAGFADATGRFLPLVCTLNATRVTDAIARLLGVGLDELDHLALQTVPGSGGLVLLPYFDGERVPNRPKSTGWLSGLRSDVSREQLARASIEGVVCSLLDGLDALAEHTVAPKRVVLVGGGARSVAYRQVFAELCDVPIVVADLDQAVATGACVQAASALDQVPAADVIVRWGLGATTAVETTGSAGGASAGDVRAAYAALRDRTG
ncbi:MAG: xylulokinase [Ilumatobacteraceae bacterium]